MASKKKLTKDKYGVDSIFDNLVKNPELFFGLVGPIGVDLDSVSEALESSLQRVNYKTHKIRVTELAKSPQIKLKIDDSSYFNKYKSLIEYGNKFRQNAKNRAAFAGVAISRIHEIRNDENPQLGTAYIIRQFKRPEEIELMRRIYGRKFIQISISGSPLDRRKLLIERIKHFNSAPKTDQECEKQAIDLIAMDNNQKDDKDGQRISDVFHLGDLFIDGIDKDLIKSTIDRFIRALFGSNQISPTKDEYGLYIATAASLRSVDLSRQVGAAIFSTKGEIISLGCNEVPKPSGGTYWADDDITIARDIEIGSDPNQDRRNEIIYDLLEKMEKAGFLSSEFTSETNGQKRLERFLSDSNLLDVQITDIIEYGRIIHAEMSAISDAARLGRSTADSSLFCTTFPCHICAKHIVAAGLKRVIYLEPYPKSYAHKLHGDSITFEKVESSTKVLFEAFIGISPRRYRDIFEKKKRKDASGKAKEWYEGVPVPLIEDKSARYIADESQAIFVTLKDNFGKDKK
jgi:deoxycytidylate deaminase